MKILKTMILLFIPVLFYSCDEEGSDAEEPKRELITVRLDNNSGTGGVAGGSCVAEGPGEVFTFIVSYRDIQVDANINPAASGVINVLVEDGERIDVEIQSAGLDFTLGSSQVSVRTISRPKSLEGSPRIIRFCPLGFSNDISFEGF